MLLTTIGLWSLNLTVSRYILVHGFEPLAYGSVRYGLAALVFAGLGQAELMLGRYDAADDRGVDDDLHRDRAPRRLRQGLGEPRALGLVERHGAPHLGELLLAALGRDRAHGLDDLAQVLRVA